jgi:hypothetical protein
VEKPTPTQAEQELIVPGLRAGHYLCFFGMHVLTPVIFDLLDSLGDLGNRQLSPALAVLASRERYLAYEVAGNRYNLGVTYGLLVAQLALAGKGRVRQRELGLPVAESEPVPVVLVQRAQHVCLWAAALLAKRVEAVRVRARHVRVRVAVGREGSGGDVARDADKVADPQHTRCNNGCAAPQAALDAAAAAAAVGVAGVAAAAAAVASR